MTDHVLERDRRVLPSGRAVGREPDGGDAARIDDALDPGVPGSVENVAGSLDVGAIEQPRLGCPQPVFGRDVKECLTPIERGIER
jgi:hypothetical protein